MLFVSSTGPEVSNLLGLDITWSEWRAVLGRGWDLQNRQGRNHVVQHLGHSGNAGDQRRKGEAGSNGDRRGQVDEKRTHDA